MASQSVSRLFVEIAPHSLQLAVVGAGGRLEGLKECALDATAVTAALAEIAASVGAANAQVLLVPPAGFAVRAGSEDATAIRTTKSLLAHAETVAAENTPPLSVVAVDAASGQGVDTVGSAPWILAGVSSSAVDAAKAQLASLGLPVGKLRLALPTRIGSVVTALQDMPESTRVLVWQVGEADAQLACVSASGCSAAGVVAAGYTQIFEAVQAGLGLKFRSAAAKLFFNNDYDFSETAGPVAERVAALLRPAITTLGCKPTALHVAGLPEGQAWLAKAVASALEVSLLSPDMAAFCAQCGLTGTAVSNGLPTSALGLLFHAAPRGGTERRAWEADWLDVNAPAPSAAVTKSPPAAPAAAPLFKGPPAATPVSDPAASAPAEPRLASAKSAKVVPTAPVAGKKAAAAATAAIPVATAVEKPVEAPAPVVAAAPAAHESKAIAPMPIVIPAILESESAERPETDTAPVADGETTAVRQHEVAPKKKPVALFAVIGAVVVIGGVGAFFMTQGKSGGDAAPAAPQISQEELRLKEVENARMLAEELKTPRSFRNERYSFEVSDRGFLRKLVGVGNRTIVDEFGWLELQGTFTGSAKPFNAGAMGDTDYKPSITKTVRDGNVVFEIKGTHPRFNIETLVTCLPTKITFETVFKPINMQDPRGPIAGVYMVKMNRQSLSLGQSAVVEPGSIEFGTKSGPMTLKFNGDAWGRPGEEGKQSVLVGANLVFFHFTGPGEGKSNVLTGEVTLP